MGVRIMGFQLCPKVWTLSRLPETAIHPFGDPMAWMTIARHSGLVELARLSRLAAGPCALTA